MASTHEQFRPDEATLTAYALGELAGAEAAEVEAWLLSHPAAQEAVEEARSVGTLLGEAFGAESETGIGEHRRHVVLAGARRETVTKVLKLPDRGGTSSLWWRRGALGAAALIAVATAGLVLRSARKGAHVEPTGAAVNGTIVHAGGRPENRHAVATNAWPSLDAAVLVDLHAGGLTLLRPEHSQGRGRRAVEPGDLRLVSLSSTEDEAPADAPADGPGWDRGPGFERSGTLKWVGPISDQTAVPSRSFSFDPS
jgi:hypothetical protein